MIRLMKRHQRIIKIIRITILWIISIKCYDSELD